MWISRTKVLGLFLFTWAWLSYDHYRPWVNFHAETLSFIAVAFLLASRLLANKSRASLPTLASCTAIFALFPWLQYFSGISFFAGDALVSSIYLVGLAGAIWIGFNNENNSSTTPSSGVNLLDVMWVPAMLSAAIGLVQWLMMSAPLAMYAVQTDPGDRAMGNLGQPNQLATLLLMGMASFANIFEKKWIGRVGFSLGIGFMSVVLVLAQSRTGMLSAIAVAGFLAWKSKFGARINAKSFVAWGIAFLIGTQLLPFVGRMLLIDGRDMVFTGGNERLNMWKQMIHGILQSPWTGYGWNQTPTAHAAGAVAYPGSMTFTNAHNLVIDLLAWSGLPVGLALTLAGMYWFFSRIWRVRQINAIYAMACLLPLLIHSMLEYPFAYAYFLLFGGFAAGVVEASMAGIKTWATDKRWLWALLVSGGLVGSYLAYEYLLIEEDFRIVRFENLHIGQTPASYEAPNIWMLSHMGAMLRAARVNATPEMPAAEIEELRKVAERFPYAAIRLRYALALGLNANPLEATHQMAVIRAMYGDYYYAAAKEVFRLEKEKYPALDVVVLP